MILTFSRYTFLYCFNSTKFMPPFQLKKKFFSFTATKHYRIKDVGKRDQKQQLIPFRPNPSLPLSFQQFQLKTTFSSSELLKHLFMDCCNYIFSIILISQLDYKLLYHKGILTPTVPSTILWRTVVLNKNI